MKKDFYEVLGVPKTATKAEIKSSYRKMAMKFHPDRNKDPDAEEKFKVINEAYEVLSNDQKKGAYDQYGHAAFDPSAGPFGGHTYSNQSGPNFTYTNTAGGNPFGGSGFDFEGFNNPFDIFEQFFGGGFNGQTARGPRLETYKIQLTFLEAANGCQKEFKIKGDKKSIKIPAGVDDGQKIKFQDFILYIDVLPDNTFRREGNDVFVNKLISFKQAVLGDAVEVTTLTGPLQIRIKPGTQPNTLIRLQGKGIRNVNGYSQGDFYIRLIVEVPTRLTGRQKDLIKQFDF